MEECNSAWMSAQDTISDLESVTCPPTEMPTMGYSMYTDTSSELTGDDLAEPSSNWMFNQMNNDAQVQEDFDLGSNTLGVTQYGNSMQYVVVDSEGRVYETCVQHGGSGDECEEGLVCWNGATAGSAGEQKSALYEAAKRNDYKIATCPHLTGPCTQLPYNFYETMFNDMNIDLAVLENLCTNEDTRELLFVMKDAHKAVCIGSGVASMDACPADHLTGSNYFCSGIQNGGGVYGWPAQFVGAIEEAYSNAMTTDGTFMDDSFHHPQCRM